jgi:membrane fusion protein (multidrug efflux system)
VLSTRLRDGLRLKSLMAIALALATVAIGIAWWLGPVWAGPQTREAYVKSDVVPLAAENDAKVLRVLVDDGDVVRPGQPLVVLDSTLLRLERERVAAAVTALEAEASGAQSNRFVLAARRDESQAELNSARAALTDAEAELRRSETLFADGWTAAAHRDSKAVAARKAHADLMKARAAWAASTREALDGNAEASALARATEQKRQQAILDERISRTVIVSPSAGTVAARRAQVGEQVAGGDRLLSIVPFTTYIEAYFPETQINRLKLGQRVRVKVDAIHNMQFHGRVRAIGAATSSEFALVPPDLSANRFIKVVRRVPVRISLDPNETYEGHRLRSGMSATVAVLH